MTAVDRPIRVLHLASFVGNIGDLANHAGARRLLAKHVPFRLEFTELEIREFYWKQRTFDAAFVDYANSFDLLIIGGGNYFELWVDHSMTGTSIDISPDLMQRLTVPTLFHSLGVDTGQGYTERSAGRFRAFIETVLDRDNMFVSVRNDGSTRALNEVLGTTMAQHIPTMPDGGFFAAPPRSATSGRSPCIGINIAGDMLDKRFDGGLNVDGFLEELATACCGLLDQQPDMRIVLMPHIWRDVSLIAQLLPRFADSYLRRRVAVGRLEPTQNGLDEFLANYQAFDLVLGMRFHANVCPIGMGVPTRGLLNYPQVQRLYEELDLPERLVDVRDHGFGVRLQDAASSDLAALPERRAESLQSVGLIEQQAQRTLSSISAWLQRALN
ncbi:MAG: polysaccharide pyruvyl transferase family protein [Hydrogenophaga sp.]|uniref:polysaccharide pyruvyl transferase family protein n=1 Tax=Hydrogenophaga sp. TaxID=1904254 RepID=UPI001D305D91|nr:polysaccharide pyruvyl transferase family protein [Hydrogenophaga sp.]MBX3611662.1 polysaccharide pyruvyl transferase family protein [Hydrogenophaga sp.]